MKTNTCAPRSLPFVCLQSRGWIHYGFHAPERHILLFRRKLPEQVVAAAQAAHVAAQAAAAAAPLPLL